MGTESSNLTASLLGSLLPASEIIIWTDIEGIRNSDPKHIADTISIRYLSYQQAERLANQGLKVIHVSMLEDPSKSGIPVTIRSAFNPNGEFTTITHQENTSLQIMINISHNDQKYFVLPDHLHHKNSTQLLIIQSSNPFIKEALIHRMSNHYSPDISCAISYYEDVHLVWGNKDYIDTLQMNLFNEFLQEESIQ
jgi:aspartokinase